MNATKQEYNIQGIELEAIKRLGGNCLGDYFSQRAA